MVESHGPLIFSIEVCRDCTSHSWNTRHDENKYSQFFSDTSREILAKVNVEILKNEKWTLD